MLHSEVMSQKFNQFILLPSVQLELKFVTQLLALICYKCWHVVYVCVIFLTTFFFVGTLPPGLGLQTSIINNAHSIPLSLIQFTAAEAAIFFSSIEVWGPVCSFGCSKGLLHNCFLIKIMIGPWGNFLNTIYRMLLIDMVSLEP